MRWSFVVCLLLVSAVLAKSRSKRSLGYIKQLFANKLSGSQKVVSAQPILAKNETYQLFKIPGYNNMVIKVSRKKDDIPATLEDLVIVKPEVAIIGSYLGTTTQTETQLAIEMVNSLLQSGILSGGRDNSIKELMVPMIPEPPRLEYFEDWKVPIIPQGPGHVFVPMGNMQHVANHNGFPVHPVKYPIVTPDVKLTPVQSIYSYKQKGPEADTTYKSYNNKDVIVTRTEKVPPLPFTIGANPYGITQPLGINPVPVPYYVNPSMIVPDNIQKPNILPHISKLPMVGRPYQFENNMQQAIRCKEIIDIKMCPHENVQVTINNGQSITSKVGKPKRSQASGVSYNEANKANEGKTNANRIAVNEFLKNHSVNGQLVSQYVYKQMNHHSRDNYTEVRVGENPPHPVYLNGPPLTKDKTFETSNENFRKDFIFVPPKDRSPLSVQSFNNEGNTGNVGTYQNNANNVFNSRVKSNDGNYYVPPLKHNVNWNTESDFKGRPIVVSELHTKKRDANYETNNDDFDKTNKRGDIPGATY